MTSNASVNYHPVYPHRPIGSITKLCKLLELKENTLLKIVDNVEAYYKKPFHKLKKDGKTSREIIDAGRTLKAIQEKIRKKILLQVKYPFYLHGGIQSRGVLSNAKPHLKSKLIIQEDIGKFFPSVSKNLVYKIWKYFFKFSPDVAEVLSELTTLADKLPQGVKTSAYLANLVFWNTEPVLVKKLHQKGYVYTRYIDDITISAPHRVDIESVLWVRRHVRQMFYGKNFREKKEKSFIVTSSKSLEVTGVVVNQKVSLHKKKIRKLRSELFFLRKSIENKYDNCAEILFDMVKTLPSHISFSNDNRKRKCMLYLSGNNDNAFFIDWQNKKFVILKGIPPQNIGLTKSKFIKIISEEQANIEFTENILQKINRSIDNEVLRKLSLYIGHQQIKAKIRSIFGRISYLGSLDKHKGRAYKSKLHEICRKIPSL